MSDKHQVTLVHPDGREYVTSDPREVNNLVFGHGYKVKAQESPVEQKDEAK